VQPKPADKADLLFIIMNRRDYMIVLVRCDDRLIHGQCIVHVISDFSVGKIYVIDNFTANNKILKSVFKKAAPPGIDTEAITEDASVEIVKSEIHTASKTLVLMKTPRSAVKLFENIPELKKELNIGPMSNRKNTMKATNYAYLTPDEVEAIRSLDKMDVRVYFNQILEQKTIEAKELAGVLA